MSESRNSYPEAIYFVDSENGIGLTRCVEGSTSQVDIGGGGALRTHALSEEVLLQEGLQFDRGPGHSPRGIFADTVNIIYLFRALASDRTDSRTEYRVRDAFFKLTAEIADEDNIVLSGKEYKYVVHKILADARKVRQYR